MYWLSGAVKVITAVASMATAIVLPPLVPRALALIEAARTSDQRKKQLEIANQELQLEIAERERAEEEIQQTNALVRLLQAVAVASNTALTLEDAILTCLREICMYTGWLVGHAYLPADDGSGDLVSTTLWYLADFDRFAAFARSPRQPVLALRPTCRDESSPAGGRSGSRISPTIPAMCVEN
jgi:hypothetical protein